MAKSSDDSRQSGREATRQQTHEIVIDAPIEAVWKAITDGEELTRWFVEEASVEPGVGGTITISWGGGDKGESRIEAWEPNQRLRLDHKFARDKGAVIVSEYTIERRGGKTVTEVRALGYSRLRRLERLLRRDRFRLGVVLSHAATLPRTSPWQAAHNHQGRR